MKLGLVSTEGETYIFKISVFYNYRRKPNFETVVNVRKNIL